MLFQILGLSTIYILLALVVALTFHEVSHAAVAARRIFSFGGQDVFVITGLLFQSLVTLNIGLALFNLIPLSPLDGSRLWQIILPTRWYYAFARFEIVGALLVLALVLANLYLRLGILEGLLCPPIRFVWTGLVGFGQPLGCG